MAPSKIRKALGVVKDSTSIGIAMVSTSNNIVSDLDIAIIKATRHEESPAHEKYIREIITLTCYSRAYISSCVSSLARRLNKTKNSTVALKTLMLIHRLLIEGDAGYEQEIFFATRRGTRLLNMSDFRDSSRSNSWDHSAFVRTYALYLDERLEFRMHGRSGRQAIIGADDEADDNAKSAAPTVATTPVREMVKIEHIFIRTRRLQVLLERFLACKPTGAAKNDRIVMVALYPIVKESFQLYHDITEIMGILIDRFMELEVPDCVKMYEIFARLGKQFDELENFYNWCKSVGIARSSEFPEIDRITPKKLEVIDEFISEKSALEDRKRGNKNLKEEMRSEIETEEKCPQLVEEDMNAIKALPPPESFSAMEEKEEAVKQEKKEESNTQQEADLLNLHEEAVSSVGQGGKLALTLFDCGEALPPASASAWEAFKDDSADWETALIQSASNLSNQKVALGGGFDKLLLEGMYQQSAAEAAPNSVPTGSASSVALGSAGKPAMLALPAPPVNGGAVTPVASVDPFAASLSVPPPVYVQMPELEKKQKLLVEEQLMWQQYQRNGMQGQLGISHLQTNYYNMGDNTRGY